MPEIIFTINEAIKKQGLSESQLARMAGLSQGTVNRLLKGKTQRPDISVIKKLCAALNLSPFALVGIPEPRKDVVLPNPTNLQREWIEIGLKMGDIEMLGWLMEIKKGRP